MSDLSKLKEDRDVIEFTCARGSTRPPRTTPDDTTVLIEIHIPGVPLGVHPPPAERGEEEGKP